MKKISKKVAVAGIAGTCLLASLAVGGTMAFLTDKDSAVNTFTVGHVSLDFEEPDWDPDPDDPNTPGDGEHIVPGSSTDKTPTITSTDEEGNMPSYLRVKMELVDSESGERITDEERIEKIMNCIRFDEDGTGLAQTIGVQGAKFTQAEIDKFPTVNPMFQEDTTYTAATPGLYYYNYVGEDNNLDTPNGEDDIFYAGDTVELFSNIVVPAEYKNSDMDVMGAFEIRLQPQAIQADGFINATEAFEALQGYDTTDHTENIDDNAIEKVDAKQAGAGE